MGAVTRVSHGRSAAALDWLRSRRAIIPSLAVLAALIGLIAWLAPADKTLGDMVKMVYVHGAVIRVTLLTFALSGVVGIGYLVASRQALYEWSEALGRTGLLLWLAYVLTSYVATVQTWGAVATFEPRWIFTFQVLVVAPVFHLVGAWLKNRRLASLLNAALAVLIFVLLSQARLVMHPLDPLGQATAFGIHVAYAILLALCGGFALQLARGVKGLSLRKASS